MLTSDQMSNLEATEREVNDREFLIKTAIDIQAALQLLISKGIISKEELDQQRNIVSTKIPKYKDALTYINQTKQEIAHYKADPQAMLRAMFNAKLKK